MRLPDRQRLALFIQVVPAVVVFVLHAGGAAMGEQLGSGFLADPERSQAGFHGAAQIAEGERLASELGGGTAPDLGDPFSTPQPLPTEPTPCSHTSISQSTAY